MDLIDMDRQFSVVCDDALARRVEALAREYGLTREEVLRQLISVGLEEVDERSSLRI